jgi:regulator of protease activity HflC (stomatin/prohibitin superfamily)
MFSLTPYVIILALVVAFFLTAASVRILREYERAVVFTLGPFQKVRGRALSC